MKNIFIARLLPLLFISSLLSNISVTAQTPKTKTIINLAPGINAPITYPNNVNPNRITLCDNADVRIFPSARPQSEVHLSINKQNPQVLLLSANTFPVVNSWQGAYWSTNGGLTWGGGDDLPNGAFGRGDPSTAFDAIGNGYVATMNAATLFADAANGYLVQRTANNGTAWQPQVAGTGVLNNFDKEMIAADDMPTSPFANNFYCSWSVLVQNPANNLVQFNRSTNQGNNFSVPITLKTGWGQGTNVQTGPNGEVYVCWADYINSTTDWTSKGLGFCRSTNGGVNFTAAQRVINYTGIRTYNSATLNDQNPDFNMTRVNDFPSMAVDKSNGAHRGRIYVALPVRENGNGRAIIRTSFSDNQGTTWSTPTTVSIPNGRQSWFPWIAVDNTNGDIFVIYYSLDEAAGFNTNTYVASSNDGGATFVTQRVSDVNHVTAQIAEFNGGYAGDYIGITAHSGRAFASWADNRTGQWQIYVSQVRDIDILGQAIFCTSTSTSYSLTNLPAGATIQWQATPTGIVTINSPTSLQTTLTKNNDGIITLTAVISNACVGQITVTKDNIAVGKPQPGPIEVILVDPFIGRIQVAIDPVPAATSYNWYKNNVMVATYHGVFAQIPITKNLCNIWYDISVEAINSCGTSAKTHKNVYVPPCNNYYIVSPNPATNDVTVSTDESNTQTTDNETFDEVRIYDLQGNLKMYQKFKKAKTANISIAALTNGTYFIEIINGVYEERQQLLIQK